jgi:hypothetical protein
LLFLNVLLLSLVELLLHLLDFLEQDDFFSFVLGSLDLSLPVGDVFGGLLFHLDEVLMVLLILSSIGHIVSGSVVELCALLLELSLLLSGSGILLESENLFSN